MATPNRFTVAVDKAVLTPWDMQAPLPPGFPIDCHYFGEALRRLEQILGPRGLDIYMVWSLDDLPVRGRNVVVLLIGDERYQVPSYASDVLAVFKTGALQPFRTYAGRSTSFYLKALDEARTLRDWSLRRRRGLAADCLGRNVFPMPLGYHAQVEVPFRPIAERSIDVFFAGGRGSPVQVHDPRSWQVRPREVARGRMFRAIDTLRAEHPAIVCQTLGVGGGGIGRLGPLAYSERLMDTRISLCPRGNFPETFRLFEAARAGCVIVSEPLPATWYFEGLPAVSISDWQQAPAVIARLWQSPDEIEDLHRRTLAWWSERGSEAALARFIAGHIDRLSSNGRPT